MSTHVFFICLIRLIMYKKERYTVLYRVIACCLLYREAVSLSRVVTCCHVHIYIFIILEVVVNGGIDTWCSVSIVPSV